ncbi:hypothetical protein ccbrp13_61290 [Ktedonobacteria bacterium brp13]|nr:hypothetical protein ccbrp13_61290 [Ktedonobacteria bacterium brp13]
MDKRKSQQYVNDLFKSVIAINNNRLSPVDSTTYKRVRKTVGKNGILELDSDYYERNVLNPLLEKEQWEKKCTESYISSALKELLFSAYKEENTEKRKKIAWEQFSKLVEEVENYSQECITFIPIGHIQLMVDKVKIGNNFTLVTVTDQMINEYLLHLGKDVENWLRSLRSKVCVEYRCIAHTDRAIDRAHEECERVFDLLRYTIYMTTPTPDKFHKFRIGRLEEVPQFIRENIVIASDYKEVHTRSSYYNGTYYNGTYETFLINQDIIEKMHDLKIFELATLIDKELDKDSFDEVILRGLYWFSKSQVQEVKENKFLNLMTVLETFLTRRDTDKITQTVAEGTAFVLEKELEQRKNKKKRIIDLYNNRSRISHGGHSAMLEADLEELEHIVAKFLTSMIERKDEFKTCKDLWDWIEDQKFA